VADVTPSAEKERPACTCSPARIDGYLIHRQACARAGKPKWHDGVVYGIRHPGSSPIGCTYCIDTLRLPIAEAPLPPASDQGADDE
jgi:hypothetical protein